MKDLLILIFIILTNPLISQVQPYEFYCDISHSKISVELSYDSSRNVYIYKYTIISGTENNGYIAAFDLDISTNSEHNPKDNSLNDNCSDWKDPRFSSFVELPRHAIPVGLSRPDPSSLPSCGIMITDFDGGKLTFGGLFYRNYIKPGESFGPLIVEAKFPPGMRVYTLTPNFSRCYGHIPETDEYWENNGEGWTRPKGYGKDEDYEMSGKTVGPIDPADYSFYNGGRAKAR